MRARILSFVGDAAESRGVQRAGLPTLSALYPTTRPGALINGTLRLSHSAMHRASEIPSCTVVHSPGMSSTSGANR